LAPATRATPHLAIQPRAAGRARGTARPTEQVVDCFVTTADGGSWIIDCGSTKHIVPNTLDLDFVTDANPVVSVRVASQQHLPVVAIGVATVLVEALRVTFSGGVHRSAKERVPMLLSNVYIIPGIASRLFLCRWGFDRDNIGTSLDADLCLTLPTGEVIPFVERGIHYAIDTLPFDKATRRGGASRATSLASPLCSSARQSRQTAFLRHRAVLLGSTRH